MTGSVWNLWCIILVPEVGDWLYPKRPKVKLRWEIQKQGGKNKYKLKNIY